MLSIGVGFSLRLGDLQIILASRKREAKKLGTLHYVKPTPIDKTTLLFSNYQLHIVYCLLHIFFCLFASILFRISLSLRLSL